MARYILSVRNNAVVISDGDRHHILHSVADFNAYLTVKAAMLNVATHDLEVMCSSTMDFPDEFTDNTDTIALAHALR